MTRAPGFDAFYRDERARLFRALALTLGNSDLAAEAVDEAMVRAYQRWNRVSSYDNPSGWVYRVGLNWGISRARRAIRRPLLHTSLVTAGPDVPDTELAAAVAALPPRHRAVVVLRFDLDWSLEQIATALNVPMGTVKSRLHRALAVLRENLEDDRES